MTPSVTPLFILRILKVQTVLSKNAQRRICQRERNNSLPSDPEDFSTLDENFTQTIDGKPFLLKNVVIDDEGHILLFTTSSNLEKLAKAEVIIMDGTFSSSPSQFKQIFTIHGFLGSGNDRLFLPLVYFLLPNKKQTTYEKAFKLLKKVAKDHKVTLDPSVILTDFETAEINAATRVFPHAKKHGCFFHLAKNLWKRMQKVGLSIPYAKSVKCQMTFRKIQALAFLEPQEVPQGLAAIQASAPKKMQPFFEYFEKTYVLGKLRADGRRGNPRFPPDFWSVKSSTEHGLPRTSNAVEGWHNKFSGIIPNKINNKFYEVLRAFQHEEQDASAKYLRFLQGDIDNRMNKKQKQKEDKLKATVAKYNGEKITMLEFIESVSLILENK